MYACYLIMFTLNMHRWINKSVKNMTISLLLFYYHGTNAIIIIMIIDPNICMIHPDYILKIKLFGKPEDLSKPDKI